MTRRRLKVKTAKCPRCGHWLTGPSTRSRLKPVHVGGADGKARCRIRNCGCVLTFDAATIKTQLKEGRDRDDAHPAAG